MHAIQNVTGTYVQHINPVFVLKEYCSSQCFCSDVAPNNNNDSTYTILEVDTIDDCNISSICIHNDSFEEPCSGLRVKFACGGSAAVFICPIYISISSLSDSEIPSEELIVVPINWLGVNGMIDPMNKEVGYVSFMKHNIKQLILLL